MEPQRLLCQSGSNLHFTVFDKPFKLSNCLGRWSVGVSCRGITNLLHKHGCHVAWTDCDGNILPIIDILLEGGLNCTFPTEVHGGTDPVELRRRHPDILIQGGFCKMRLAGVERKAIVIENGKTTMNLDNW